MGTPRGYKPWYGYGYSSSSCRRQIEFKSLENAYHIYIYVRVLNHSNIACENRAISTRWAPKQNKSINLAAVAVVRIYLHRRDVYFTYKSQIGGVESLRAYIVFVRLLRIYRPLRFHPRAREQ